MLHLISIKSLKKIKVDHKEQEIVKCSHCNVKAAQWKIRDHESNICMEKVIPCTNSPFGCDLMLKRQVLFNKLIRNGHVLFVRLGKISSIIFTAVQLLFHIALWFS